ncbi:hypothetical protein XENORESO_011717 [Xenotaenia resolanae]|uniref:Uncharacterized protein n=1 Tax=Xenotaenia resolanae TaxID=208358 RepID=A0ABV0W8W1_9TELE
MSSHDTYGLSRANSRQETENKQTIHLAAPVGLHCEEVVPVQCRHPRDPGLYTLGTPGDTVWWLKVGQRMDHRLAAPMSSHATYGLSRVNSRQETKQTDTPRPRHCQLVAQGRSR